MLTSLGSIRGGIRPWDLFVTNAGLIGVIDAIVAGVLATVAAVTLGLGAAPSAVAGIVVGGLVLGALSLYLARSWRAAIRSFGVRFGADASFEQTHGGVAVDDVRPVVPPSV